MKPSERNRHDRKLVAKAIECANEETAEVFEEWLERLEGFEKDTLTEKQRRWAASVAGIETYENLYSAGKVPRGREVPTPAVLLHRPLTPPPRKKHG
jgi:hypothetical protein